MSRQQQRDESHSGAVQWRCRSCYCFSVQYSSTFSSFVSVDLLIRQGFVEKLNHAEFDDLNSMLRDLTAIEAGTQHGAKEQGLFQVMKVGYLDSWRFKREDLFESMHPSKTFALTHVIFTKCIACKK